jgi:hypothetical protein
MFGLCVLCGICGAYVIIQVTKIALKICFKELM